MDIAAIAPASPPVARPAFELLTLDGLDKRRSPYRRYEAVLGAIYSDLGGSERLSEAQKQLASRCAFLSMTTETMEASSLAGESIELDLYGQLCDRLGRNLQRLGLKRVQLDITPDLSTYLAGKQEPPRRARKPRKPRKPKSVAT